MTLQDKSHNSTSDFDTIMPLFGLKFGMHSFFSQTTDTFALKLHTLIGHHQMTLQDKFQNSISDFDTIMPFFYFEHARLFLTNNRCYCFETSHTYWISSNDLAGISSRTLPHILTKLCPFLVFEILL